MKKGFLCFFICFLFLGCVSDNVVVDENVAGQVGENVCDEDIFIEEINHKLTNVPVFLPEGTNGSFGRKGKYVLFGDWPQSLKDDDVVISPDDKGVIINGWRCFTGSDGDYYVKITGKPFVHRNAVYHFENGDVIEEGTEYYFRLEPIKWRVIWESDVSGELEDCLEPGMENTHGGEFINRKLFLVAENILVSSAFFEDKVFIRNLNNQTIYPNNYKYSSVRAFLNCLNGDEYGAGDFRQTGFLNRAFSGAARDFIVVSDVDNSVASTKNYSTGANYYGENQFACENTQDKVFLLSKSDVTNEKYGFDIGNLEKSRKFLVRKLTDFAKATGAGADIGDGDAGVGNGENDKYFEVDYGWWWTRSPFYRDGKRCYRVFADGDRFQSFYVNDESAGVVPGLKIRDMNNN